MKDPKLYRHKGWWNLRWYDPITRRRKDKALGWNGSRRVAETIKRRLVKRWEAGDFDPFADDFKVHSVSIREAATEWIKDRDFPEASIEKLWSLIGILEAESPAGVSIDMLTTSDVQRVVNRCKSPSGQRSYFGTLRSLLQWSVNAGYLKSNPAVGVKLAKKPKNRTPPFLSRPEYHALQTVAENQFWHDVIAFSVGTGLRLSEVSRARFGDVSNGMIWVNGKGNKDRTVPLSELADVAIESRAEAIGGWIDGERIFPYAPSSLSHGAKRHLRSAGLSEIYRFHSFRHTFASWLRMGGVPIDRISEWMGHESITTTMIYAHIQPESVKDEIRGILMPQ